MFRPYISFLTIENAADLDIEFIWFLVDLAKEDILHNLRFVE